MARPANFNRKAFVSFIVTFIILILGFTGIILYFSPPGRIAHWVEWRFLGLTKEGWQAVHTIFSFIFVIAAGFHLYYNWVVFKNYLKSKLRAGIKMGRELAVSGTLIAGVLVLTLAEVPPFSSVMDFGSYLSDSWASQETEPPVPHAELMTVKELSGELKVDLNRALRQLNQAGLRGVDSLIVIEALAKRNGITPREIAAKISALSGAAAVSGAGYGYGRMTVGQAAEKLGIPPATAARRLSAAEIRYAPDENLREIAEHNDRTPLQLADIIRGDTGNNGGEKQ